MFQSILRVQFTIYASVGEDAMLYLSKNHEEGLKIAVLAGATVTPTVTPSVSGAQLVRLHGELSIKASEGLTLHTFSANTIDYEVMDKSVFTMYIA